MSEAVIVDRIMLTGKRHDNSVDLCKGVAIILVVIGHAVQHYSLRFDDNILFRIIYSFHMPLFFILSGMVTNPDGGSRIAKAAKRLVIPALFWYLLQYWVEGSYKSVNVVAYIVQFLVSPDNGLWFLWVLFFIIAIFVFTRRLEARIGVMAYPLAVVLLYAVPLNRFGLHLMKYYLPFFLLGYSLARCRSWWATRWKILLLVSALVYPVMLPFWHRTAEQAGIGKSNLLHAGMGLMAFLGVRYLEGLAGSAIAICLLQMLSKIADLKVICWIGLQSLEIYACQFIGFKIVHGEGTIVIAAGSLLALAIAVVLANTLGRIRYVGTVLFGRTGLSTRTFAKTA